ncbi:PREDICTED: microtubule-associated proteins 1A/1B light chain 3C [Colobus angolensis palliatus]|uniref:Microtubule associated protein 1 light chain 3 gamma n=4 Tax=Cercopithecidae TaxID=9527 RepID=A0A2K5I511_COLAP|nr:PREDICTED: microtubule-associated proteins 1A/1B light chain 3C [Colobus angolensis palliatus]
MPPPQKIPSVRPFKQRKSLAIRQEEVAGIRAKFPNKIPVVVERYPRETFLPLLDKTKFLVPQELTMTQFLSIIRSRMVLRATEAFYLLVNNKSLVSTSVTMAEIYRDYKDEDGFVYMTYASQETFGCLESAAPRDGSSLEDRPCSPLWPMSGRMCSDRRVRRWQKGLVFSCVYAGGV